MTRRIAAVAIAATVIVDGGDRTAAQKPGECYHDWSKVTFASQITNSREYNTIVTACAGGRAGAVPWDEYIGTFQTAVRSGVYLGAVQESLRLLLRMLERERDYLRESVRNPAPPPGRATDSAVRSLPIDSMFDGAPSTPNRFIIDPEFRPWVPDYFRKMLRETFRVEVRIVDRQGKVSIRRGDKSIDLAEALAGGDHLALRPGDILDATSGHIELESEGGRLTLLSNSTLMFGVEGQCILTSDAGGRRGLSSHYLIRGTLLWASTTAPVRHCLTVRAGPYPAAPRGTAFTATNEFAQGVNSFTIDVSSGVVDVSDDASDKTWDIAAGESAVFQYTPRPTTSEIAWNVTNSCDQPVRLKFYEFGGAQRLQWPAVYDVPAGASRRLVTSEATIGRQVCYGAKSDNGKFTWGVGFDGQSSCQRCCNNTTATSHVRDVNLTCR